jgi:hypothetical protein
MMKTSNLTIHPPMRIMLTVSSKCVLGGNHIINS